VPGREYRVGEGSAPGSAWALSEVLTGAALRAFGLAADDGNRAVGGVPMSGVRRDSRGLIRDL
jgi:hypothetical protein